MKLGGVRGDIHVNNLMQIIEGNIWLIDSGMLKENGEHVFQIYPSGSAQVSLAQSGWK